MKGLLIIILFIVFYIGYLTFTKVLFGYNNLVIIEGLLYHKPINRMEDISIDKKTVKCVVLNFLRDDRRLYTIKLNIDSVDQGSNALGGVN